MPRETIIFGNGLGMAIDPNWFSLENAIQWVWNEEELLPDNCRQLVRSCLPADRNDVPHGEDDLDQLQLALSATDLLESLQQGEIHWLSDAGREFPVAVRRFLYQVAVRFHFCELGLPEEFIQPFVAFLEETNSHIATLNYDNLLYQPLIEAGCLRGYNGCLVGGFHGDGFSEENLERRYDRNFGYYLHLHGSPLFIERQQAVLKLRQRDLDPEIERVSSHIVLTHVAHKPLVIAGSNLLTAYWNYLRDAIVESDGVTLFGYSGLDIHLNMILRRLAQGKRVRVIEWDGAGGQLERLAHWHDILSLDIELYRFESVLEFENWG